MDSKQKNIKKALIKTTNTIKRKYRNLYKDRVDTENNLNDLYKPITTPLNKLVEEMQQQPDKINKILEKDKFESYSENKNTINGEDENNDDNGSNGNITDDDDNDIEHSDVVDDDDDDTDYYETPTKKRTRLEYSDDETNNQVTEELQYQPYNKINKYLEVLTTDNSDKVYGPKLINNELKLGNHNIYIVGDTLRIDESKFEFSKGLFNLIFYKKPPAGYTNSDLNEYKKILNLTNVHRRNFDAKQPVKSNTGHKYMYIIKPLLMQSKQGRGIESEYMEVLKKNIDYKYWDDANELVDRLRLLISSKSAGHSGHNNEIMSIIEELREANIIE